VDAGCGKTVQGDSKNCTECDVKIATKRLAEVARAGRVAGHSPEAIAKEAATHRKHAQAKAAWNPATVLNKIVSTSRGGANAFKVYRKMTIH
jgi:hypothetical protein